MMAKIIASVVLSFLKNNTNNEMIVRKIFKTSDSLFLNFSNCSTVKKI
jgi:hypothetical protein